MNIFGIKTKPVRTINQIGTVLSQRCQEHTRDRCKLVFIDRLTIFVHDALFQAQALTGSQIIGVCAEVVCFSCGSRVKIISLAWILRVEAGISRAGIGKR